VPRFICQIYEVQDPAEAEQLVAMGVDHIGSVLLPEEAPSNIRIAETITAVRRTGAVSSLIPLFSDTDRVLEALARYQPDIVHFCEILELRGEGRDYIETLVGLQRAVHRVFPRMRIMRSIPIGPPGCADLVPTLALAECFAPVSDLFLTDTLLVHDAEGTNQPVSGFVGITGKICDWDMARRLVVHSPLPVILAGGISPRNAHAALCRVHPWGIDSCTGTNAQDQKARSIRFRKDPAKVRELLAAVRRAEADLVPGAPKILN
jgi:phosphoribosylanthranilate isomerase